MEPLFPVTPDLAVASLEELEAFLVTNGEAIETVGADPLTYVVEGDGDEGRTSRQILAQIETAYEAQASARARHAELSAEADEADEEDEPEEVEEVGDDEFVAQAQALAARSRELAPVEAPEAVEPVEAPGTEIVAAAPAAPATRQRRRLAPPAARTTPHRDTQVERVSFLASGGSSVGMEMSMREIAAEMIARRSNFGSIPPGTHGERYPIAKASWAEGYPEGRRLTGNSFDDAEMIAAALDPKLMKAEIRRRREQGFSLLAAGASVLCAPVTPYYGLQNISTSVRPVRGMLPGFGADRGGLRFARPASLADVVDVGLGIGVVTAAQDAGGTDDTKTVLEIDCPDWTEVDTDAIYRRLQIKNRLARTFPELVEQWTNLAMSAQARLAESRLLTGIDAAGKQVVAGSLGLGATATLFSQYLTAANSIRNRHRADPEAVLRLAIPDWTVDLMISDVIRSQFERFDTDEDRIAALFRSFDIEPAFYIDSAAGRAQVFGVQNDGPLLPFPPSVLGYMYVEGSFLYLDGTTLEVGLIRDSILNATNMYELFSEVFEAVAFIGVESYSIESQVCDSGVVAAPGDMTGLCPIDYALAT